jgi:hypothetical protein
VLPPLLVKPGCTFDEFLDRGLGQPQSCAAEMIADEVKAPLDPADEGLVTAATARRSFHRVGASTRMSSMKRT